MVADHQRSPKRRPRSSYVPFARSTVMALWQLDAFEYRLTDMRVVTIYQERLQTSLGAFI